MFTRKKHWGPPFLNKQRLVKSSVNRLLKNKIYKYMTLISKNVYTDKFNEIVNKYSNT